MAVQSPSSTQSRVRSANPVLNDTPACRNKTYTLGRKTKFMDEEGKESGPPQPILIQGSAIIQQSEATQPAKKTSHTSASQPTSGSSSRVEAALAKVQFYVDNKPEQSGMTVIALLFVFVVPIGLLFFTEGDAIYDDGLTGLCCLSLLSGIALILVIASKDASWKKSLDEAKIEVLKEANANVPEKAMKGWYLGAGALFFVGMFFEAVFMTFLAFVFVLIGALGTSSYRAEINQHIARIQQGMQKP